MASRLNPYLTFDGKAREAMEFYRDVPGGDAEADAELSGYFDKLSADGTVIEPLVTAPWGDKFGMLKDRFDITWMVNIAGAQQA